MDSLKFLGDVGLDKDVFLGSATADEIAAQDSIGLHTEDRWILGAEINL